MVLHLSFSILFTSLPLYTHHHPSYRFSIAFALTFLLLRFRSMPSPPLAALHLLLLVWVYRDYAQPRALLLFFSSFASSPASTWTSSVMMALSEHSSVSDVGRLKATKRLKGACAGNHSSLDD